MNRFEMACFWTWVSALVAVTSAVATGEPQGSMQTRLELGATVADNELLKDGRLLMLLEREGELLASFTDERTQFTQTTRRKDKPRNPLAD